MDKGCIALISLARRLIITFSNLFDSIFPSLSTYFNQTFLNAYKEATQASAAMYRTPGQNNQQPNRQLEAKQCRTAINSKSIYQSEMQTFKPLLSHFMPDHFTTYSEEKQ